jgi:hypothetical protein
MICGEWHSLILHTARECCMPFTSLCTLFCLPHAEVSLGGSRWSAAHASGQLRTKPCRARTGRTRGGPAFTTVRAACFLLMCPAAIYPSRPLLRARGPQGRVIAEGEQEPDEWGLGACRELSRHARGPHAAVLAWRVCPHLMPERTPALLQSSCVRLSFYQHVMHMCDQPACQCCRLFVSRQREDACWQDLI